MNRIEKKLLVTDGKKGGNRLNAIPQKILIFSISLKLKIAWLSAVLTAGLLVAAPVCVFGKEFSLVSLPIPVEIDSQLVHCSLYLKLEMKSYDVSFEKFAASPMDKAQAMFVTAAQAIRKDDAAKFESVWTSPDQMKRNSQVTVALADNSTANWLKVARSNFDFDHLTVVAEVLVGSETIFIWDSATKAGIRRNAFYVGLDQKNQLRLSAVSSNAPVEGLVLNTFVAARTAPDIYKPLPNINLRYQFPIPFPGSGDSGEHPVFFEFDGSPMDFPIGDEKVKAPDPLLKFLRNAAFALRSGKDNAFASDFTPQSQKRVRQWLAEGENLRQAKRRSQPAGSPVSNFQTAGLLSAMVANVKFVLNADPIFLVFQAHAPGNSWTPQQLTYSYVLRERGTYKIANFSAAIPLDDFLQEPALFDKNILKSAPKK